MKKLLMLFALLAFVVSGAWVLAREPDQERQMEPHIKCCFQDGQCLETKRDNCMLKKGIIVQDCTNCPGVWGKGTKGQQFSMWLGWTPTLPQPFLPTNEPRGKVLSTS